MKNQIEMWPQKEGTPRVSPVEIAVRDTVRPRALLCSDEHQTQVTGFDPWPATEITDPLAGWRVSLPALSDSGVGYFGHHTAALSAQCPGTFPKDKWVIVYPVCVFNSKSTWYPWLTLMLMAAYVQTFCSRSLIEVCRKVYSTNF